MSTAVHDSILKLNNLSVEYYSEDSKVVALDNVSLSVGGGGYTLGIVGESGSGKTTLGMSIMRLIEPPGRIKSGEVIFDGKNVLGMSDRELRSYRWSEVSMVYQSAMNSLNPVKSVSDPIIEVLQEHLRESKNEARERAVQLLSDVGINGDRANDYPHELSGGMRQRVVIALALALSPKLLIADEPTSALDVVVQNQILGLLRREVIQKGLSLIFITHEISLLREIVENIAVMYAGEIVEIGPTEKILLEPLHPYTEMLINTLVTMRTKYEVLGNWTKEKLNEPLKPNSEHSLNSCKFSDRCKYAFSICHSRRPALVQVQKDRWVSCHKYP